ncbi:hypothetical protein PHO31112_03223 [Pandoraea horticolens]|uniref:Uncharacterized protein n=1 Tax=Pandoraea horticolens TaxID=2508298 RepID=A0A5E4WGW4_9BURK|nr:hypothetical protein PHO31112_03223 [Pandoraea horticolens]
MSTAFQARQRLLVTAFALVAAGSMHLAHSPFA